MTLDEIIEATKAESAERQAKYPLAMVQREVRKKRPTYGFLRVLRARPFSVIAEIKRKSPSMGSINEAAIDVAHSVYHSHSVVAAISVLTQHSHFGGSWTDLKKVRTLTQCRPKPILRKDFIFSEYEVYFSRWIGADAILLMANVLGKRALKELHDLAVSIGLDVLCEVHDEAEIEMLPEGVKLCGINSRRFKGVNQQKPVGLKLRQALSPFLGGGATNRDTQTDLNTFSLYGKLPENSVKVAESGVSSENIGEVLAQYPFNAALIGTSLLKCSRAQMQQHLDRIQAEAERVLEGRTTSPTAQLAFAE